MFVRGEGRAGFCIQQDVAELSLSRKVEAKGILCVCEREEVGELGRVYDREEGEEGDEAGQARVAADDEASVTTKEDSMLSV